MRSDYHRRLDALRVDLGRMCALAGDAAGHATDVLLTCRPGDGPSDVVEAAALVAADVARLRALDDAVQRRVVSILALQSPVARELREVVSAIQIAADANRMGGLAAHVARLSRRDQPDCVVPDELRPSFVQMGALAVDLADRCRVAVLDADAALTPQILDDDVAMEELHRGIHRVVMNARWSHGAAAAMDAVLLGRFYGRFADHGAEIARRVRFQTSGSSGRSDAFV